MVSFVLSLLFLPLQTLLRNTSTSLTIVHKQQSQKAGCSHLFSAIITYIRTIGQQYLAFCTVCDQEGCLVDCYCMTTAEYGTVIGSSVVLRQFLTKTTGQVVVGGGEEKGGSLVTTFLPRDGVILCMSGVDRHRAPIPVSSLVI